MTDVVLVQPKVGDMDSFRTKPSLPLGLLHSVSLVAREYDVKLIDQRIEGWEYKLKRELQKNPLCVATTAMTGPQIKRALEISNFVRNNSNSFIVWGGVHASLLPQQTLVHKDIDFIVKGEGEISFYELVKAISRKKGIKGIKGIFYKNKKGEIVSNKEREFTDLTVLPGLPYDIVNLNDYMPLYSGKKSVAIQGSRGCIHNCAYCYNSVFNRGCWRAFSVKRILNEAKFLAEKGAKNLYFVDDNFFVNLKRAREIAVGIKEIGIDWQLQGVTIQSVNGMDKSYLKMLENSNLKRMTFGVETGSERIRRLIGKTATSSSDYLAMNKRLARYNILLFYSFIVGFPTEQEEDRKKTIELLFKILHDNRNARNSPIYNFIPYPRTKMLDFAKELGFKEPQNLEGWAKYEWENVNVPYIKDKEKFSRMYFSSIFLDNKFSEYNTLSIVKALSMIYRPIARFRIKNQFFKLMIEKDFAKLIERRIK